jgi:cysteinyl-tRNA synthetase
MVIYNTLTQKKEEFQPLVPGHVKMYVCGPTVYGLLHVGNFRGPIFFNLVRNWLEKTGLKVDFAFNFTDVDDKIIDRAAKDGVTAHEISEKYIKEFWTDFNALGLRKHTYNPKVTETMKPIVGLVGELVSKGAAYVADDGEVLYSVRDFKDYGKLSRKNIDDLESGARVVVDKKKRDPLDFALWKPAKPGEPHWPSPWCEGRPGWHIECSAMVRSIFGDTIDIHGGGSDLIFPHHENEIAQSEGATGKTFARVWMHNNMLTFGGGKMSKSLGNIMTVRDFLAKYDAEILKFMMLSVHYRSLSDFSEQAISSAIAGLGRVYSALALAEKTMAAGAGAGGPSGGAVVGAGTGAGAGAGAGQKATKAFEDALAKASADAVAALNDDFNTPELFAAMYGLIKAFNTAIRAGMKVTPEVLATAQKFRAWIHEQGALMAMFQQDALAYLTSLDDRLLAEKGLSRSEIDALVSERSAVRAAKDFKKSDELRDALLAKGIAVSDTPQGSVWEVAK